MTGLRPDEFLKAFIIYESGTGSSLAEELKTRLERYKISAFVAPKDVQAGADEILTRLGALDDAEEIFVIITEGMLRKSDEVEKEIRYAVKRKASIRPYRQASISVAEAVNFLKNVGLGANRQCPEFNNAEDITNHILREKRTGNYFSGTKNSQSNDSRIARGDLGLVPNTAVVIGVDAGGTRTSLKAGDGQSHQETKGVGSSSSNSEIQSSLDYIFTTIESIATETKPVFVWLSFAGYTVATRKRYGSLVKPHINALFKKHSGAVGLANDVTTLLMAREDPVVAAIVGTGSVVATQLKDGSIERLGGQEWVASDNGSGFWIALDGIRAAFDLSQRDLLKRPLVTRLVETYRRKGDPVTREVVNEIVRDLATSGTGDRATSGKGDRATSGADIKVRVAEFARMVCEAALRGDKVAQDVVTKAAGDIASLIARLYERLIEDDRERNLSALPHVLVCGSVGTNNFYFEALKTALDRLLGEVVTSSGGASSIDVNVPMERLPAGVDEALKLAGRLAERKSPSASIDQFEVFRS